MPKPVKIVFLGAGSAIFTRGLIADLINQADMPPSHVVMHDVNASVLKTMTRYCQMMVEAAGAPIAITAEPDRARAFDGADFIIITITVGGRQADRVDIQVPLKYGLCQTIGDTLGPGGLMRIFRAYDTFKGFVDDMEKHCPHALVLNFTNPMTMICRLMNRLGSIITVGLCHGTWGILRRLASRLGLDAEHMGVVPAGVNHFIWFLELTYGGKDLYPRLRRELIDKGKGDFDRVSAELFRIYGYYPSPGGSHLGEFLPYFLTSEEVMKRYGLSVRDYAAKEGRQRDARAHCRDVVAGRAELPPVPTRRGRGDSEGAIPIISSVVNDKDDVEFANIPNKGYIPNLPNDVVVEVPTRFGKKGPKGEQVSPLPPAIQAHAMHIVHTQELGVEAAMTGDYDLAFQALLSDYLVRDIGDAEKMLKEMFRRSRRWLPQFHAKR